jgi:fimbrial chaperone protein
VQIMTVTLRTLVRRISFLLILSATPAGASQFTVNPTRVELSARVSSGVVSVRNDGKAPIRLQVKAHAWTQTLDGAVKLDPTDDVVVFPTMLTLEPGDERRLRVAVAAKPGDIERTYRIFLEELPPPKNQTDGVNGVQVLTRVGIPIFLAPVKAAAQATVSDVGLAQDGLHFQVENQGNTHFVPETLRVRAVGANGQLVSDKSSDGWYILARSSRRYTMAFEQKDCARIRSVLIDVTLPDTTLKGRLDTPGGACGR